MFLPLHPNRLLYFLLIINLCKAVSMCQLLFEVLLIHLIIMISLVLICILEAIKLTYKSIIKYFHDHSARECWGQVLNPGRQMTLEPGLQTDTDVYKHLSCYSQRLLILQRNRVLGQEWMRIGFLTIHQEILLQLRQ